MTSFGQADDHKDTAFRVLTADVEVNAIYSPVDVALLGQASFAPRVVFFYPLLLESADRAGREPGVDLVILRRDRPRCLSRLTVPDESPAAFGPRRLESASWKSPVEIRLR